MKNPVGQKVGFLFIDLIDSTCITLDGFDESELACGTHSAKLSQARSAVCGLNACRVSRVGRK